MNVAGYARFRTGALSIGVLVLSLAALSCRGRSDTGETAEPTASVSVIQPRGEAVDPPKEFSWTAYPGAANYRVRIADEDAVWPLFVKTVTEPKLVLEPKEVTAITPGRIHEWGIEALDTQGRVIAKGGSRFRYMPPGAVSP